MKLPNLLPLRQSPNATHKKMARRRKWQRTWGFEPLEQRALLAAVTSVQTSGLGITAGTGSLNADDVATLTVNFDAAVVVTRTSGSPTLTLNTGARAYYSGGSGTTALNFQYIVGARQNTSDLTVTAMSTNGSTIQTAGVNATLTGAVTNPAGTLAIDTVAPTATITRIGATSQTAGTPLQFSVAFSEAVTGVATSSFSLTTAGVSGAAVASVVQGIDAANYTVTVTSSGPGTVGLNITGATVKDIAGNGFGGGSFAVGSGLSAGASRSIATADFNNDGRMDWVVANGASSSVTVALGNGTGGTSNVIIFNAASTPAFVSTADVNADGRPDIIVANSGSANISVLLANSAVAGTFLAATNFSVAGNPVSLSLADFNADGKLDLAVAHATTSVSILLGNGTGGFTATTNAVVPTGTNIVSAVDVSGDGRPDLVTSSGSLGSVGVALGSGTGTFGTSTTFALVSSPSGITVNHFNGDANLDIAGTSASQPFLGSIRGTGNGNFVLSSQITLASGLVGIASADLTGDGKVDVAATSGSSQSFYYAPGNGDVTFGSVRTTTLSGTPSAIALADINGDGRLDALVANSSFNSVTPLLNNNVPQAGPVFTVTNQAPTDLSLSNNSVREEQSAGLLVGTFTTTDSDSNDTFQYSLVAGTDSTDNASFKISGNQLRTNSIFDFETKSSFKVRVRTTDSGGLFVERALTIQVLNEFEAESPTFIQQIAPAATLSNPIGAQFGKSLAISSDYYLIGAPQVNAGAFASSGQAFLYSAATGQLLQTFTNPSPGNTDQMGWSVALSGNTVLLGANFDSVSGFAAGRAMLFNALTGALMATLSNPTPATNDMFGVSVAAGNGFLAVGAARDAFNTTLTSGSVHVYNSSGVFQRTIVNPSPSVGSQFGQAIAMEGTTLVAASSDAVYVFNVTTGAILRTIMNPTGSRTDRFGTSVALSGNRLAVGSTDGLAIGIRSGNVRVYEISSGALLQTYTPLVGAVGDSFGASISMDSQSLTVGAPGTDIDGVSDVGAAYLYNLSTGALRGGMSNPSPTSGDQFGAAVATLGVKSIVGTPFDDTNGSDQGNVFVFSRVAAFAHSLSANTLTENNAVGAVVGTLSATAGANAPVSYALVSGTGGTDNSSFTIVGNQLRANTVFNYEAKSNYSVLIEATDAVGMKSRLIASITVLDINEAPTNIELSNSSIEELKSVGTLVGTLSTTDPEGGSIFSYTLTTGSYADNNYFLVAGSQVQSNVAFDYEARNHYEIEVRSQDSGGLSTTKVLTVRINNVNQPVVTAQPRYDLQIVADLNSTIQNSNPSYAVEMNGYTYFTASSLVYGRELYRVNAVTGVTEMVADLAWDTGDANPQSLVVLGGSLYFTATYSYLDPNAPPGGLPQTLFGIWKSDGTATGTVLVREIESVLSAPLNPKPGFVVGNRALFFVGDESFGEQLWATDGSAPGTTLLQMFPSSFGMLSSSFPAVVAGGNLYFNRSVDTSYGNHSLWRSDGTAPGTFELRQVSSFMPLDFGSSFDPSLTAIGSTVYFSSLDSFAGMELWKTDGTISSTMQVAEINPTGSSAPAGMIAFQGSVYFSANDGTNNRELWKSNGSTASMVANISTALFGDSLSALSERFTVFGGHLYFTADDGSGAGLQLFRTDGSGPGTVAFPRDVATVFHPIRLVALPERLLIINDYYGPSANQLWSTDGTQAGNQLLTNFVSISSVATTGSQAFLGLNDGTVGTELWVSNGLPAGTQLLSDFRPGINGGMNGIVAISQGRAFLAVNDGVRGAELGISDGTVAGTRFIDVARGTPASNVTEVAQIGSSIYIATKQGLYLSQTQTGAITLLTSNDVSGLTPVGSKMFFSSADNGASSNRELWVSDGTATGTKRVYDIRTGSIGSNPEQLIAFGGQVYFVANDGVNGEELWKSGGAVNDPLNTTLVFQFGANAADGNIEHMEVVGNNLYVLANDKLFIGNNSNSFTQLASDASSLMAWNGVVYFSGFTSATGNELWRTDGTVVGTYMVKDIVPGPNSSYPGGGVVANEDPSVSLRAATESRLVFRAFDASGAGQLFATNGTSAGTVSLTNAPFIESGFGLVPINLSTVGNQVYFQGYTQEAGLELWTSDGTVEGTRLVADLRPGTYPDPLNDDPSNPIGFSNLNEMTAFRDKLFFSADSPAAGRELWVSDGSASGSYMVKDIREGTASGGPKRLFVLGNSLYFAADTDDYGIGTLGSGELFRLNESPYLSGQSSIVAAGNAIQFRLDSFDNDGDTVTYQIVNAPQHGTVTISGNIATYTPAAGYTGSDSFGIVARDGSLSSDTANFNVAVRASVPTITFAFASSIINEGDQAFVVNVTLSAPATEDLNLPYVYGFGDTESQNVVAFAAGQSTSQIVIPITNDNAFQTTQQLLEVTLKSNSYAVLGSITQHVATILDDDALPKIFFVDSARTYSELDGTIKVEVGLSSAAQTTVTATISLNTLLGGGVSDFTYAPQTQVTFLPGQVRQNVLVRIINDQLPESREGLLAGIAAVNGASIIADPTRFRSLIWIADDDASVINITPANSLMTEGDTLTLTATRTGGTLSTPLTVNFNTFLGGTTLADYSLSSTAFQFASGASQATITLTAVDDGSVDSFEGLTFVLAESPSYVIGDQSTTYIGIYDNDTTTVTLDYAPEEKTIFDKPIKNYWESVLVNRQIRFVAKLSAPSDTTISIPMVVSDGTQSGYANLGSDFSFSTANVVFAPGVTEVSRILVILDDDVPEGIEKLTIALAPAPNQWSLRPQGALSDDGLSKTLTITDDDYMVSVRSLSAADGKVKNTFVENAGTINFEVSLNRAPDEDVRVDLKLTTNLQRSEFTAADFNSNLERTIVLRKGIQSMIVPIQLNDDSQFEKDAERITLRAARSNGFYFDATDSRTVTITDNEQPPSLRFSSGVGLRLSDSGDSILVGLELDAGVPANAYVNVSFGGTAIRGEDYRIVGAAGAGVLNIGTGATSFGIEIVPLDNKLLDGDKTVEITIVPIGSLAISIPPEGLKSTATIVETAKASSACSITDVASQPFTVDLGDITSCLGPLNADIDSGSFTGGSINSGIKYKAGDVALITTQQGIIDGGTVFFDSNFNGVQDYLDKNRNGRQEVDEPSEPGAISDLGGTIALTIPSGFDRIADGVIADGVIADGVIDSTEGRLVSFGGTDTATGLAWSMVMSAPFGIYAVTPLTTVLESLMRRNSLSEAVATETVQAAFGLASFNIAGGNTIYDVLSRDAAAALAYTRQVAISSASILTASLFSGQNNESRQQFEQQWMELLADVVANQQTTIDLSNPDLIKPLITSINRTLATPFSQDVIDGATALISLGIGRAQTIRLEQFAEPMQFLEAITRVKKLMHGALADDLKQVGAGTTSIATVLGAYNGISAPNFDSLAATQTIGQIIPPVLGVTSVNIQEGPSGTRTLDFVVELLGAHSGTVTTQYATVDGTATSAGGDYVPANGTLTWLPGDNSSRTVSVTVNGDADFELDEFLSLILRGATNAVVRRAQGFGGIQNDDTLSLANTTAAGDFSVVYTDDISFVRNSSLVQRGPLVNPLNVVFTGTATEPTEFSLDFSSSEARADQYTLVGGSAVDTLSINSGRFDKLYHVINANQSGWSSLRSEQATESTIDWTSIDRFDYMVSTLGELVIQIPTSVSSVIVDDPDLTTTGVMRVYSVSNEFAPIYFTVPASKLTIVKLNQSTSVTSGTVDPAFTGNIEVLFAGVTPTADQIAENLPTGSVVGQFATLNPILIGSYQVVLVSGNGDSGNSMFTIGPDGKTLQTAAMFNFESTNEYSIRTRTTGPYETEFESVFSVFVVNQNETPTDLSLTTDIVSENSAIGSVVGTLQTTDPDAGNTFTYAFVSGEGQYDNSAFTMDEAGVIRSSVALNFETKPSYAIRVLATDQGGLSIEKTLTIQVANMLEISQPIQIGDGTAQRSVVKQLVVTFDQSVIVDPGAFVVQQRERTAAGTLQLNTVVTAVTLTAIAGGGTRATLTFSGAYTRAGTNGLVDGNYQLTINGSLIRSLATNVGLDADNNGVAGGQRTLGTADHDNFFALLGDANGNGQVDPEDLLGANNAFRSRVGQPKYNLAYDINGNGQIDTQDLLGIQNNFRRRRVFF